MPHIEIFLTVRAKSKMVRKGQTCIQHTHLTDRSFLSKNLGMQDFLIISSVLFVEIKQRHVFGTSFSFVNCLCYS